MSCTHTIATHTHTSGTGPACIWLEDFEGTPNTGALAGGWGDQRAVHARCGASIFKPKRKISAPRGGLTPSDPASHFFPGKISFPSPPYPACSHPPTHFSHPRPPNVSFEGETACPESFSGTRADLSDLSFTTDHCCFSRSPSLTNYSLLLQEVRVVSLGHWVCRVQRVWVCRGQWVCRPLQTNKFLQTEPNQHKRKHKKNSAPTFMAHNDFNDF